MSKPLNFRYMKTVKGYVGNKHTYYKIRKVRFTATHIWAEYNIDLDNDNWFGMGCWKLEDIDSLMTTKPRNVRG